MSQIESLSSRTCQVIAPVTLCSIYVVIVLDIISKPIYPSTGIIDGAWKKLGLGPEEAFSKAFVNNIIIVSVFLLLLIIVTLIILLVFYMEWHGCLSYYFYIPPFIIMAILTPTYLRDVLSALNWFGLDYITVVLIVFNFTALGVVSIFGVGVEAPLCVQQFYLIHNSAILAVLIVNSLPGWAPWMLLIFLVMWDLFAVLAPFGPLNLIINLAEREGVVDMPGLVYSTDVTRNEDKSLQQKQVVQEEITSTNITAKEVDSDLQTAEKDLPAEKKIEQVAEDIRREEEEEFERGVRLGLGDFIFYGVLIGKASCERDWVVTLSCYVSILVGLSVTLLLLATLKKPLPALPVSISLGLVSFSLSLYYGAPFSERLAVEQIFI